MNSSFFNFHNQEISLSVLSLTEPSELVVLGHFSCRAPVSAPRTVVVESAGCRGSLPPRCDLASRHRARDTRPGTGHPGPERRDPLGMIFARWLRPQIWPACRSSNGPRSPPDARTCDGKPRLGLRVECGISPGAPAHCWTDLLPGGGRRGRHRPCRSRITEPAVQWHRRSSLLPTDSDKNRCKMTDHDDQ